MNLEFVLSFLVFLVICAAVIAACLIEKPENNAEQSSYEQECITSFLPIYNGKTVSVIPQTNCRPKKIEE